MRILLIEDDDVLGAALRDHGVADGHAVDWVQRLDDAEEHRLSAGYDLILLDLMLPDGDGLKFLRQFRAAGEVTPVIILTARDQISTRIEGLNAGADDYLVKPFDLAELSARIAAVARRYRGKPNPVVTLGPLSVDVTARTVTRDGKAVSLTRREWAALEALMRRPGTVVSKASLEDSLYSFDVDLGSNTVEVHISNLRKKIGKDMVETVRGLGYRIRGAE